MTETVTFSGLQLRRAAGSDFFVGMAVPYDEISYLTEHRQGERFVAGAFARSVVAVGNGRRYPLVLDHYPDRRIGTVIHLEETPRGLLAGLRFDATVEARRAVEDAATRPIGLSVAFYAGDVARGLHGERVVVDATLDHLAIVPVPAYESARTFVPSRQLAIRSASPTGVVRWHVPPSLAGVWGR